MSEEKPKPKPKPLPEGYWYGSANQHHATLRKIVQVMQAELSVHAKLKAIDDVLKDVHLMGDTPKK